MTRRHDPKEIAAALERLARGESQASVARSLGVHQSTIRIWRRREAAPVVIAQQPVEPAPATAPAFSPVAPAASTTEESTPPGGAFTGADLIRRALASAEGAPTDPPPPAAEFPAPDPGAAPPPIPPPSGAELIGMVECVHQLAVSGIASIHGVELSDQAFDRFATFLPRERRALQMFAPYAARFVPGLLGNFDKLAAGAFLLFWGMSLARSYKSISKLAKPPEPETPAPAAPAAPADPAAPFGLTDGFSVSTA